MELVAPADGPIIFSAACSARAARALSPVSMTCQQRSRVSLNVVDDCTSAALTARVAIQGRATCTKEGRGFAELIDLTPGGPQTLAVGKTNYQTVNVR